MKKIVALVLAMVMVLGLATVASAATSYSSQENKGTTTTITAAEKYAVYNAADTTKQADWTVVAYTGMSTLVETVDGVATTGYIPAYYTATYGGSTFYLYEVADAACANFRIFKGDTFMTYVAATSAAVSDYVSDTVVFVAEGEGCGTYNADVYMNTVTYAAAEATTIGYDTTLAILDGKYVVLSGTAKYPVAHDFTDKDETYKSLTDATVVAVTCDECGKAFTVVKNGKIPATYKGLTQAYGNAYTILLQSEVGAADAPAADAGDKVESAETFDAGIAMYVGMSVMAAAGSAVVLKKKD